MFENSVKNKPCLHGFATGLPPVVFFGGKNQEFFLRFSMISTV
ncbi:hypothetical protein CU040_1549 [Enterococcus faecium]|nr:hypothetical protein [Enterococcus faecium]